MSAPQSTENDLRLRLHNYGTAEWIRRCELNEMLRVAQGCVDALDALDNERTKRQQTELELDAALMQLQGLKDLLSQAVDDIESWSGYASTYFHEKHDLKGCLARYRAALDVSPTTTTRE